MKRANVKTGVRKLLTLSLVLAFMGTATACTNSAKNNNGTDSMAGNNGTNGTTANG